MAQQNTLLVIDGIINLILGVVLLVFPTALVSFLGVPEVQHAFYPSVLGGVLMGIAFALFIESNNTTGSAIGLGLAGAVSINLCGGLVLAFWLLFGDLGLPLRGTIFLWVLVIVLVGISAVEVAARFKSNRHPG